MNPGIDPATDTHGGAADSIKLQIKAGTSKGLWGGSVEMWWEEGEQKWVKGEKKRNLLRANVTEPDPNQYLRVVRRRRGACVQHISERWKHQSG